MRCRDGRCTNNIDVRTCENSGYSVLSHSYDVAYDDAADDEDDDDDVDPTISSSSSSSSSPPRYDDGG
jgi:hypothetical protein